VISLIDLKLTVLARVFYHSLRYIFLIMCYNTKLETGIICH